MLFRRRRGEPEEKLILTTTDNSRTTGTRTSRLVQREENGPVKIVRGSHEVQEVTLPVGQTTTTTTKIVWLRHCEACHNVAGLTSKRGITQKLARTPLCTLDGAVQSILMGQELASKFAASESGDPRGPLSSSSPTTAPQRTKIRLFCSFLPRTMMSAKLLHKGISAWIKQQNSNSTLELDETITPLCHINEATEKWDLYDKQVERRQKQGFWMDRTTVNRINGEKALMYANVLNNKLSETTGFGQINVDVISKHDENSSCFAPSTVKDYADFVTEIVPKLSKSPDDEGSDVVNIIVGHSRYIRNFVIPDQQRLHHMHALVTEYHSADSATFCTITERISPPEKPADVLQKAQNTGYVPAGKPVEPWQQCEYGKKGDFEESQKEENEKQTAAQVSRFQEMFRQGLSESELTRHLVPNKESLGSSPRAV